MGYAWPVGRLELGWLGETFAVAALAEAKCQDASLRFGACSLLAQLVV